MQKEQATKEKKSGIAHKTNIGIFGSISHTLRAKQPVRCSQFIDQVRASFRVLTLCKPDLEAVFSTALFIDNYNMASDVSRLIMEFLTEFEKIKNDKLYGKTDIERSSVEALNVRDVRLCMKLAGLLRNQEYKSYLAKQLEK